jgi:hypothetical protein
LAVVVGVGARVRGGVRMSGGLDVGTAERIRTRAL